MKSKIKRSATIYKIFFPFLPWAVCRYVCVCWYLCRNVYVCIIFCLDFLPWASDPCYLPTWAKIPISVISSSTSLLSSEQFLWSFWLQQLEWSSKGQSNKWKESTLADLKCLLLWLGPQEQLKWDTDLWLLNSLCNLKGFIGKNISTTGCEHLKDLEYILLISVSTTLSSVRN